MAPPVERALEEIARLLKPNGFLVATVPCTPDDVMREHFPGLHEYRVIRLGAGGVLVNRRADGTLEARDHLAFHEGPGEVLEMRQFGPSGLRARLTEAGFREVSFLLDDVPEAGIRFDADVSQPLVARKETFGLSAAARGELVDNWMAAHRESQARGERQRMASRSRWVRLGRLFGVGPKFHI